MECPNCELINPSEDQRFDCGYDFQTKLVQEPYPHKKPVSTRLPWLWPGYVMAVLFLIAEIIAVAEQKGFEYVMMLALAAWLYWLYCVYKFHDVMENIPGYEHPISSNRAVAMHFIPLYNLYWTFKWSSQIARFVNWRMQSRAMNGNLVGLLVLLSVLVGRGIDGFLGLALLFSSGVYISRRIKKALMAPPVPTSAMVPWGVRGPLGL